MKERDEEAFAKVQLPVIGESVRSLGKTAPTLLKPKPNRPIRRSAKKLARAEVIAAQKRRWTLRASKTSLKTHGTDLWPTEGFARLSLRKPVTLNTEWELLT